MSAHRKAKRAAAVERNLTSPDERRRWYRDLAAMDDTTRAAVLAARGKPAEVARRFRISPAAVKILRLEAKEQQA